MSFRLLLILLTMLSVLSRTVAGLILLIWGSQNDLPVIIHLFNGVLVLYGIGLLVSDEFKTLSPFPFVILFLSEVIIFIVNLFAINYHFDKWYDVHFPVTDQIVIGSFLDVLINLILVAYYFFFVRRKNHLKDACSHR